MDLRAQFVLDDLGVLHVLEVLFLSLLSHGLKLLALGLRDPMLPLGHDQLLDVLGRQVGHLLLDLVEDLVLKEFLSGGRLLRHLQCSDLLLEFLDLLLVRVLTVGSDAAHRRDV